MPRVGNRGEWGEPYAAIRILGEGRLYIADYNGERNPNEWLTVLELIRQETKERLVSYINNDNVDIDIFVNNDLIISVPATEFLIAADRLAEEIKTGRNRSFAVSPDMDRFLDLIEIQHIKATSADKNDIYLSVEDPRSGIVRQHIGFSIKSNFGHDPTLFNTAPASGFIYHLDNMDDALMTAVNNILDSRGHAAVGERCDILIAHECNPTFVGFPIASRARCPSFGENLDIINPRLVPVIERILGEHFFYHYPESDMVPVIDRIIEENPCGITRPEVKYPAMMKSFIYAAYCGMTASILWDGIGEVNGGFIKVSEDGDVVAHYAMESEAFKEYLYNNCYFEYPATDRGHGDYGKVYRGADGEYYFNLNFQIRYS